jgi:hypothetical protein
MLDLNRSFCAYESSAGQAVITPADNQRNLKVQYDSILILAIHLSLKKKEVLDVVCKIDDRFIVVPKIGMTDKNTGTWYYRY